MLKNNNINCSIIVFSIYSVLFMSSVIFGEDPGEFLSLEEIQQVIVEIESIEKSVRNVHIESEVWMEERQKTTDPWERTLNYISAKSIFSGFPIKKARVDVHSEITEGYWADQNRRMYSIEKYTSIYDGKIGRNIYYEYGDFENVKKINKGDIIQGPPETIRGRKSGSVTGLRMTMYGFFCDREDIQSFSQYFKIAISPEALQSGAFEFLREDYNGKRCIRFSMKASPSFKMNWWFDPSCGYSLLKYENIKINQNGMEFVDERIHITKLIKVSDNLWWPIEGIIETDRRKPHEPFARTVYHAQNIIVNDPNLNETIFNVSFPAGCLVEDKVNNRKFKIPEDPNSL